MGFCRIRYADSHREGDHFDAGLLGIEGSRILQGTHELAGLATGADAVRLVRQGDIKDTALQAFVLACCTAIRLGHILSPFFQLAKNLAQPLLIVNLGDHQAHPPLFCEVPGPAGRAILAREDWGRASGNPLLNLKQFSQKKGKRI